MINKLKDYISRFLKSNGYELKKLDHNHQLLLNNVFSTDNTKKVLISYLTTPFTSAITLSHTNLTECYTAAEIFRDLGFNVDVVDLNASINIDYSQYEIVYGQGNMYEKAFESPSAHALNKIYYGTGNNPFFYYLEAGKKLHEFYTDKKKFIPESCRLIGKSNSLPTTNSDAIICLGNDFCKKTYTSITPYIPIFNLNAFYFETVKMGTIKRNITSSRKNFLWFGSGGLITKGLADCIDFFSESDEYNLHICGATPSERRFWEIYNPILKKHNNIINHGFINLKSEKFLEIINQCSFAIFPSVSEGGSPSLLNLMANGGLIPIATEACSVDIDQFGFILEDSSVASIKKIIRKLDMFSDEQLEKKSIKVQEYTRENYTFDNYKKNLRSHIESCLLTQ
jgi:hypothetical protein